MLASTLRPGEVVVGATLATGPQVELLVTEHAVCRYRERCKPHISEEAAAMELMWLIRLCPIREGCPDWFYGQSRPMFHVDIGDVAVLVDPDPAQCARLRTRTVMTCAEYPKQRHSQRA